MSDDPVASRIEQARADAAYRAKVARTLADLSRGVRHGETLDRAGLARLRRDVLGDREGTR